MEDIEKGNIDAEAVINSEQFSNSLKRFVVILVLGIIIPQPFGFMFFIVANAVLQLKMLVGEYFSIPLQVKIFALIIGGAIIIPQPFGIIYGIVTSIAWRLYRMSQGWRDPREVAMGNTISEIKDWFNKE